MNVFNAKVAREVGRLTGWRDKIWSRRYQAIVISHEEAAQVERLTYVLAHSVKENLVARVEEWPGVHAGPALIAGKPMEGVWYDRSREYLARMKGDDAGPEQFAEPEVLSFVQVPCWEHLTPEQYRARIAGLIQKIEADAAAERARTGRQPLGPEAIRQQNPTSQPNHVKKSPARASTPSPSGLAERSTKRTPGLWRPSGMRQKSCGMEIATRLSPSAAFRLTCRSFEKFRRHSRQQDDPQGGPFQPSDPVCTASSIGDLAVLFHFLLTSSRASY